jgi:2-hydroxy-3-keto-5-methylthiopentenyl-1-phosphate phosphatase
MSDSDESNSVKSALKDDDLSVGGSESSEVIEAEVNSIEEVVRTMKVPFSSIVVSKRNSGKSFLVRDLVYNMSKQQRIHQVIVMSNTSGLNLNKDYDFIDKKFLTTFAQEKIERLMKIQAKAIKAGKIREVLLVLDDVIGGDGTKKAEGNRLIRSLYANGRHYHISVVLLSQIANRLLEPPLRENSDYIFFSRLGQRGLETLWESIPVIQKKEFIRFCSTHNKDFTFILYDNMTQSNDPMDFLFLVKAEERKFLLNQKALA